MSVDISVRAFGHGAKRHEVSSHLACAHLPDNEVPSDQHAKDVGGWELTSQGPACHPPKDIEGCWPTSPFLIRTQPPLRLGDYAASDWRETESLPIPGFRLVKIKG